MKNTYIYIMWVFFMENMMGYLDYKKDINNNYFQKISSKIFFKAEYKELDKNTGIILINNNVINEKNLVKIIKLKNKKNIKNIVISNNIEIQTDLENLNLLNGKFIMKNIIIFVLKYLFYYLEKDIRLESLYILIDDDKNKDIIFDLACEFRSISIVTDNIKKLKRLEKKLSNNENIISSISNNYKKSLKKANIIVNFDYDNCTLQKFKINRDSIIINLYKEKLDMKNSYQGLVIENIKIDYQDFNNFIIDLKEFDKTICYESIILDKKYYEIKDMFVKDKCKINYLIGSKGKVDILEIKNISKKFAYLDKTDK